MFRIGKWIETESRLVVAEDGLVKGEHGVTANGYKIPFEDDDNAMKFSLW
jgi:hypothetical protein